MLTPPPDGAWVVVPVKCFALAKSRLAPVLDSEAREDHARAFCAHVLAASAYAAVAGTVVATNCAAVERFARERGAFTLRDGAERSLAAIVDRCLATIAQRGARSAIVLMSDLPRLGADEVLAMLHALDRAPVVLAPDRREEGTNALGLSPPDRLETCFGTADSFRLHLERARREGVEASVYRSDGVAWDIDSPDDLTQLRPYASGGARLSWKRKRPSRVSAP